MDEDLKEGFVRLGRTIENLGVRVVHCDNSYHMNILLRDLQTELYLLHNKIITLAFTENQ